MPAAELAVDAQLVRSLLREQHPDLAGLDLQPLANGWDNTIFRLGRDFTVRLPRRRAAVQLLLNEQRWLPLFAAATSVRLPAPVRVGKPSALFPWPWSVNPWFDGGPAIEAEPADRGALAVPLARFLADIHRPAPDGAPPNPVRGVRLMARDKAFRARLESPGMPEPQRLARLWQQLSGVPAWTGPALWLHGDLHPANILVGDTGLAAVIDFGDLTGGDPATDLATAWMTFDGPARSVFCSAVTQLCGTDEDTWLRARGWALNMATALLMHSDDNPPLFRLGQHALAQVLSDS